MLSEDKENIFVSNKKIGNIIREIKNNEPSGNFGTEKI